MSYNVDLISPEEKDRLYEIYESRLLSLAKLKSTVAV